MARSKNSSRKGVKSAKPHKPAKTGNKPKSASKDPTKYALQLKSLQDAAHASNMLPLNTYKLPPGTATQTPCWLSGRPLCENEVFSVPMKNPVGFKSTYTEIEWKKKLILIGAFASPVAAMAWCDFTNQSDLKVNVAEYYRSDMLVTDAQRLVDIQQCLHAGLADGTRIARLMDLCAPTARELALIHGHVEKYIARKRAKGNSKAPTSITLTTVDDCGEVTAEIERVMTSGELLAASE